MTFTQTHADRLLRLADVVEKAGLEGMYDQNSFPPVSGECGCAEYHAVFTLLIAIDDWEEVLPYYGLTSGEHCELFGHDGCGDAQRSGDHAARYIREFVKRKLPCRDKSTKSAGSGNAPAAKG
jgi:hypothetical protein